MRDIIYSKNIILDFMEIECFYIGYFFLLKILIENDFYFVKIY